MKSTRNRIIPAAAIILLSVFLLAACAESVPRVIPVAIYSPGAPFTTNFNHDDPRRQIKCSLTFEVLDEAAIEELDSFNYRIRSSILDVLGSLTMEEITTNRNLDVIAARIVEKVNVDLDTSVDLITRAYITEFLIS